MNKYIKSALLFSFIFLVYSCGNGEKVFDYNDRYSTMDLTVNPSPLVLDNDNNTGNIVISYPLDKLFMLDLKTDALTENFMINLPADKDGKIPELKPLYCLNSIEVTGKCSIPIKYTPKSGSSHKGEINLFFAYLEDPVGTEVKEHILQIKGTNNTQMSLVFSIPDPISLSLATARTFDVKIALTPADATCSNLEFKSESETIAKIEKVDNMTGRITAVDKGETKITATCDGLSASATVKVND